MCKNNEQKSKYDINSLRHLKARLLCVLGYAAFFRASDLCRKKNLDIKCQDDFVDINIRTYRRGNSVQKVIEKFNSFFFFWSSSMLKGYLRLADNGNDSDECTCRYVRLFISNISYKLSLINISQSYMYTYVRNCF